MSLGPDIMQIARRRMVEALKRDGITDPQVLEAMGEIPRQFFVEESLRNQAYDNNPLNIGMQQTISQPTMVATMTQALSLSGREKVLEIGTGSGYQTAILAQLSDWVYSVELISGLYYRARDVLEKLRIFNINLMMGDGSLGWPEKAPFDAIMVTAGAPQIPEPLLAQLAENGRLVIPVGPAGMQTLVRITRTPDKLVREDLVGCRFVPLKGRHGWA